MLTTTRSCAKGQTLLKTWCLVSRTGHSLWRRLSHQPTKGSSWIIQTPRIWLGIIGGHGTWQQLGREGVENYTTTKKINQYLKYLLKLCIADATRWITQNQFWSTWGRRAWCSTWTRTSPTWSSSTTQTSSWSPSTRSRCPARTQRSSFRRLVMLTWLSPCRWGCYCQWMILLVSTFWHFPKLTGNVSPLAPILYETPLCIYLWSPPSVIR